MISRQRIEPTGKQVKRMRDLLGSVPQATRYEWRTDEGQRCLDAMRKLQEEGVPLTWIASELELDITMLYQAFSKYRPDRKVSV